MRWGAGVVGVWCVAVALVVPAPASSMSCASAVVVEGQVLIGHGRIPYRGRLPEERGSLPAYEPACGEEDRDRDVTVTAFRGIPSTVAVSSRDASSSLYTAPGSLVAMADHPMHRVFYAGAARPAVRRSRRCRDAGAITGTMMAPAYFTTLFLRTELGERYVRVVAQSRIANRPAHQPVLEGQRLTVSVRRCGRNLVAKRIRLVGPAVRQELVSRRRDPSHLPVVVGGTATALACLVAVFVLLRHGPGRETA